jgi:thiamine pyrophosphate-dependent acetolactate synthase large subunit-like protein
VNRLECLQAIAPLITDQLVVTTNGGTGSEWQACAPTVESQLQVKTLGLCSSIALGLALALPRRKVIVFDADGALLMNLCSLPTIARQQPANLVHVVFDNQVYESSGGIKTQTAAGTDLAGHARAAGYRHVHAVENVADFTARFRETLNADHLVFIHARVESARAKVPPLAVDEVENKYRLIRYIERTEQIAVLAPTQSASVRI